MWTKSVRVNEERLYQVLVIYWQVPQSEVKNLIYVTCTVILSNNYYGNTCMRKHSAIIQEQVPSGFVLFWGNPQSSSNLKTNFMLSSYQKKQKQTPLTAQLVGKTINNSNTLQSWWPFPVRYTLQLASLVWWVCCQRWSYFHFLWVCFRHVNSTFSSNPTGL